MRGNWAGIDASDLPSDALAVDWVLFGCLSPKCSFLIHHCGAGITHAALLPEDTVTQLERLRRSIAFSVHDHLPPLLLRSRRKPADTSSTRIPLPCRWAALLRRDHTRCVVESGVR